MAHALKNAGKKKSVHNVREEFQCIVDPPNPLHTNTNTDAQTQDANTGTHHHNHNHHHHNVMCVCARTHVRSMSDTNEVGDFSPIGVTPSTNEICAKSLTKVLQCTNYDVIECTHVSINRT